MSRLHLRASQRRRLEHVLRTARDAGLFRRVLAILEVDSGRSIAETARLLRTSRVTVYHWIGRFQRTRDPTSLVDHRGGNRPSVWDEELQGVLRASMGHRPEPFGYQAVEWTVPLLGEHLALWCGVRPSASSIRRQLHALGYVWKRPRYVLDPDPEREKKKANPPGNPPTATALRQVVRGRNGPPALPASAPHGGCAANRRRCQSRGSMPGESSSARSTSTLGIGCSWHVSGSEVRTSELSWQSFTVITGAGRSPCSWTRIQATLHTVRRTWPLSWASA